MINVIVIVTNPYYKHIDACALQSSLLHSSAAALIAI